jgi:hypothetical protein
MREYKNLQNNLQASDFADDLTSKPIPFSITERLYTPEETLIVSASRNAG